MQKQEICGNLENSKIGFAETSIDDDMKIKATDFREIKDIRMCAKVKEAVNTMVEKDSTRQFYVDNGRLIINIICLVTNIVLIVHKYLVEVVLISFLSGGHWNQ